MKDLHCHIMYGIDDGSKSLDESIEMLKKLESKGVTDVVLTPHYIEDTNYNANNLTKLKLFREIYFAAKAENININLYYGNEVMINNSLISELYSDILTINSSKYLLIELPMNKEYPDLDIIIDELLYNKITPIIAHPERYSFVKNDYKWVKKYIDAGVLFQGDYESLFGKYGNTANKTLRKLIKQNMIHFLGSDMHSKNSEVHADELYKVLKKLIKDENKIQDILNNNFDKVIENKEIYS